MKEHIRSIIQKVTGADEIQEKETLQNLWSGYGKITRYDLAGAKIGTVVVKHVQPPAPGKHPRGWNTDLSHQRKLKSYQIEVAWFESWSKYCDDLCRIPQCYGCASFGDEVVIVLEDLDAAGFPERRYRVPGNCDSCTA